MSNSANNISAIPVWKKGATPEERLLELAHMARQNPDRFALMVLVYQQTNEKGTQTRLAYSDDISTTEALGVLEAGKMDMYLQARGLLE